jgi:predicted transcriptional regulator
MKKEIVITVRVDAETNEVIRKLAEEGDRTVAWVTRQLIAEALENRGLVKPGKKK